MIKVSVIIPIYNVSEYLKNCLDSIINQTLREIEIICIDDCSTDDSLYIAEEYLKKDNRIKILKHVVNKGLGPARNTGLKEANGEYISFVDSDDFVDIKFLEILYNTAKKYDSDISMTRNYIEYNKDYKASNKKIKFKSYSEKGSLNTYYYSPKNVWTKLYRRQFLLDKNIFFMDIKYGAEDTDFNLRVFLNEPYVSFNNKALYYYRIRNDSLSSLVGIKLESAVNGIKQMENSINYCKNNFIDSLPQIYLMTFETVLYFFNLCTTKNKEEFYPYMRNFVNNIDIYDSFYKDLINKYFLIKSNDDFKSYMIEQLSLELKELKKSYSNLYNKLSFLISIRKWFDNLRNKKLES